MTQAVGEVTEGDLKLVWTLLMVVLILYSTWTGAIPAEASSTEWLRFTFKLGFAALLSSWVLLHAVRYAILFGKGDTRCPE